MKESISAQPALIFIPDISGFTRFVTDTEINHSQHIIRELLEVLIQANEIGLNISEIEGDAILFYRFGASPGAEALAQQVRKMFINFHEHLVRYENRRICQCGACKSAHSLSLKFVTHYGSVAMNQVGAHTKLFGKDVIVAHRLLKNGIPHHEYALFTQSLIEASQDWHEMPRFCWAEPEQGSETYDSGPVNYTFLALSPLCRELKSPVELPPLMKGQPVIMLEVKRQLDAPAAVIMEKLLDLNLRPEWAGIGIKLISPHEINRAGTIHQCLLPDDAKRPEFRTENFQRSDNRISFDETEVNGRFSNRYVLVPESPDRTLLRIQIWVKDQLLLKLIFRFIMAGKLRRQLRKNLHNLEILLQREYEAAGRWEKALVLN